MRLLTVDIPVVKDGLVDGGVVVHVHGQHPVRRPCVPYLRVYPVICIVRQPHGGEVDAPPVSGELIGAEGELRIVPAGDALQEPQVGPVLELREGGEGGLGRGVMPGWRIGGQGGTHLGLYAVAALHVFSVCCGHDVVRQQRHGAGEGGVIAGVAVFPFPVIFPLALVHPLAVVPPFPIVPPFAVSTLASPGAVFRIFCVMPLHVGMPLHVLMPFPVHMPLPVGNPAAAPHAPVGRELLRV